ncbi:receptor-like protein kinase HSL1, partial [Trifolium pratense]
MGYAPSEATFMYWRHKIAQKSPAALEWVDNLPKQKWTQAYDG